MRSWAPRILALLAVAAIGAVLLTMPPWILEQVTRLRDAGVSESWIRIYLGVVISGGLLLAGALLWIVMRLWRATRRRYRYRAEDQRAPSELTPEEKRKQIERNLAQAESLRESESIDAATKQELKRLIAEVESKRQAKRLEIVAFGTVSSGKSAVLNALAGRDVFTTELKGGTTVRRNEVQWQGNDQVVLVDTPGLAEADDECHQQVATQAARNADLVLFVVDGPLRDYEYRLLQHLRSMEKHILICLNKTDWYDSEQQVKLLSQLADQLSGLVDRADIIPVQAQPVKRRRVLQAVDGTTSEEWVDVPPDVSKLAERMMEVLRQSGHDLLLANLLMQSRALLDEARQKARRALDEEAWRIVDRYMWAAGSAAALSPLPVLDLAAGSALTTKMVIDLARVYQREFDLEAASQLLGQLGKNLLAILGASAATPAVTSAVASLLKTVPGAGTIAGGLLQGLVQVLITRWVGSVFIAYFGAEMESRPVSLPDVARQEWQRLTTPAELAKLVQAARRHWRNQRGDEQTEQEESRQDG